MFVVGTEGADRERLRDAAKNWGDNEPRLAAWMADSLLEGLGVLALPAEHRKRVRTMNGVDRVNLEVKRRTRIARIFPNEESLLRLVSAVLMEQPEEWETGRRYLTMS